MKGLGRNIKFWVWMLEKTVLIMLASMLAVGVMFTVMEGGNNMEELSKTISSYLLMLPFLTVFMNALSGATGYFPVSVSFGAVRRQSCIAMLIAQHLMVLELIVLLCICNSVFPDTTQAQFLKRYAIGFVGILLLLMGMGTMVSAICIRCGRILGVVVYIGVVIVMVMLAGVFIVVINATGGLELKGGLQNILNGPPLLILGMVVDLGMALIHYWAVRKIDLQLA